MAFRVAGVGDDRGAPGSATLGVGRVGRVVHAAEDRRRQIRRAGHRGQTLR